MNSKSILKQTPNQIYCQCVKEEYKKFSTAENNPNISTNMRISQVVQNSLGGNVRFGNNDYLGYFPPSTSPPPLRNRF